MLRKAALLLPLLLCACELYSSPPPHIVSIDPEEVLVGETTTLSITLDAPLPIKVDYGARTAELLMPTLRIGEREVPITGLEADGTLVAHLPTNLSVGQQDVRLELDNGSESLSEQGLRVLPAPPPLEPQDGAEDDGADGDGGGGAPGPDTSPPDSPDPGDGTSAPLRITGLSIEPIADQVRDVPFSITLRVEGPDAARFTGQVQLSSNKGHVSPNLSNAFSGGVRREQVVLDKQGGQVVLTVRVGAELVARSNPFKVSVK